MDPDRMEEALERIVQWSEAYPLDMFPEPDWKQVALVLEACGMRVDSVAASVMRGVVTEVGKIAREGLNK